MVKTISIFEQQTSISLFGSMSIGVLSLLFLSANHSSRKFHGEPLSMPALAGKRISLGGSSRKALSFAHLAG